MKDSIFMSCPLEAAGSDKVRSFEVDRITGEYYCHNCKEFGNIRELNLDEED